jgi:hypothetical protein
LPTEHRSGMVSMAERLAVFLPGDTTTDRKVILEARP